MYFPLASSNGFNGIERHIVNLKVLKFHLPYYWFIGFLKCLISNVCNTYFKMSILLFVKFLPKKTFFLLPFPLKTINIALKKKQKSNFYLFSKVSVFFFFWSNFFPKKNIVTSNFPMKTIKLAFSFLLKCNIYVFVSHQ